MYLKGLVEREGSTVKGPESRKRTQRRLSPGNRQQAAKRRLERPHEICCEGPGGT